jgi:hypothetical protein
MTQTDLDTQLGVYGRCAARGTGRRHTTAEILGYTAAAGGLAFAGGDAMGAIVHNATGVTFSTVSNDTYLTWDVDGAGGTLSMWLDAGSASDAEVGFQAGVVATAASYGLAKALPNGFQVGPALASGTFATSWGYLVQDSQLGFQDFLSTTAYFGFRFNGATGTPGTQYGWAKARFETFGASDEGSRLSIFEWAFDDNGAAIAVGDTGAVPAPATPLLALLGLGAMGIGSYRRRRDAGMKRLAEERVAD